MCQELRVRSQDPRARSKESGGATGGATAIPSTAVAAAATTSGMTAPAGRERSHKSSVPQTTPQRPRAASPRPHGGLLGQH